MSGSFILAADIGGTNSRFALFELKTAGPEGSLQLRLLPQSKICLPTASFNSFGELLDSLRQRPAPGGFCLLGDYKPAAVSLAVPGPVLRQGPEQGGGQLCRAPNIAWPLSSFEAGETLKPVLGTAAPLALLNDFAAQGLACLLPEILGLQRLLPGNASPAAPTLIIGAGTGLGKAIILPQPALPPDEMPPDETSPDEMSPGETPQPEAGQPDRAGQACADSQNNQRGQSGQDGQPGQPGQNGQNLTARLPGQGLRAAQCRILPSEGGHSLFPFNGPEEVDFQNFLLAKTNRKQAIGDMVVTGSGLAALFAWQAGLETLPPPPSVTPRLAEQPRVLELMARFYGRACRNLVLETLALGGVYLSGGLLAHVPALRAHPEFAREFRFSETQAATLEKVPVWWVSNQDSGLWGAALHGAGLLAASA